MATKQNGSWLISGKIGDKVYVIRDGKNYVRSLPAKSSKLPTEKQLAWRTSFAMATQFLMPLSALINESYRRINPKKSGMQLSVQQLLKEALKGVYPNIEIDPSKVSLIRGNLPAPTGNMTYVARTNELDFHWSQVSNVFQNSADELGILIWCRTLNEFYSKLNPGVRRDQEFCTIPIPLEFKGQEIHVWLFYRSADHRSYSNSTYMGQVAGADYFRQTKHKFI